MTQLVESIQTSLEEKEITVEVTAVTVQAVAVAPTDAPTPKPTPAKAAEKDPTIPERPAGRSMGLMTFGIALFLFGIISIVVYYASQTQTGEVVRTVSAQGEQFKGEVVRTVSAQGE